MANPPRQPGFPWPGDGKLTSRDIDAIVKKIRKPLRVDHTMTLQETAGGTLLGVKQAAGAGPVTNMRWFRVISNAELLAAAVGESTNDFKCRQSLGCGTDDAPSLWGVWTDLNDLTCNQADQNPQPELVYFPGDYATCAFNTNDLGCDSTSWEDRIVQAFWSEPNGRWETDSQKTREIEQIDFVRFCAEKRPLIDCAGDCLGYDNTDTQFIFDGLVKREVESCTFECGGDNVAFDCWIICNDVSQLPAGQTCFIGRRVADAYTITYCPFRSENGDGPTVTETRPVYDIGCCKCGCPKDELYLEMFLMGYKWDNVGPGGCTIAEQVDHPQNGKRIPMTLYPQPPDPSCPTGVLYKAWFAVEWEIPIFLVQLNPVGTDPYEVYIRPDCLTGLEYDAWADDGDAQGTGGGCFVPWPFPSHEADMDDRAFYVSTLKQYVSGTVSGGNHLCEDQWQTCRFCYELRFCCEPDIQNPGDKLITTMTIRHCYPPGHPIYEFGPSPDVTLQDPNADLYDLQAIGDAQGLQNVQQLCDGRLWAEVDQLWGRADPLDDLPINTYYGWPHLNQHVFGGRPVWQHDSLDDVPDNSCGVTLDPACPCTVKWWMKIGWNCDGS